MSSSQLTDPGDGFSSGVDGEVDLVEAVGVGAGSNLRLLY